MVGEGRWYSAVNGPKKLVAECLCKGFFYLISFSVSAASWFVWLPPPSLSHRGTARGRPASAEYGDGQQNCCMKSLLFVYCFVQ